MKNLSIVYNKFIKIDAKLTVMKFNPSCDCLAIGDDMREIRVMNITDQSYIIMGRWLAHTSKVTSLEWSSDGSRIISSSTGGEVFVWNPKIHRDYFGSKLAHQGGVLSVTYDDKGNIYSSGCDNCIKYWKVTIN